MDNNKPTISEVSVPQGKKEDLYDNTLDRRSQTQVNNRNADYDPGVPGTATAATHDLPRREDVAAATEIGDPNGRIPSDQNIRDQLEAARRSSLPVGTSSSVQAHSIADTHAPTSLEDGIGKGNYAPGYEKAYDAVLQKSYEGAGHAPVELPHERLEPGAGT